MATRGTEAQGKIYLKQYSFMTSVAKSTTTNFEIQAFELVSFFSLSIQLTNVSLSRRQGNLDSAGPEGDDQRVRPPLRSERCPALS